MIKVSAPGIILCLIIAALATVMQNLSFWPFTLANGTHPLEAIMLAIVLGIIVGNVIALPKNFTPGIKFSSKKILYLAIILLGARLNLSDIAHLSVKVLLIILVCTISVFFVGLLLSKLFSINKNTSILLSVGTAICGSAAIAATAPVIKANESEISVSIAAINLLGLIAMFAFPALGHLLHLSQTQFAIWAGASIQAVPQVVAAGFAYGHVAGTLATLVKMVRVLLLAPFILALSIWQAKSGAKIMSDGDNKFNWQLYFPPFILLFFAVVVMNSLGWLKEFHFSTLSVSPHTIAASTSNFLMAMALAGIGLSTHFKTLYRSGRKPVLIASLAAVFLAGLCFALLV